MVAKVDTQGSSFNLYNSGIPEEETGKTTVGSGNIGENIKNFFSSLFDVEKNPNLKAFVTFFQGGSQSKLENDPEVNQKKLQNATENLKNNKELRETLIAALGTDGGAEEIAALMIKMSYLNREQALEQRLQAHSMARSDLEGAASEMKEAAVKQLAAAVVSAVITVVTAAISIGMSASSASDAKSALKDAKAASKAPGAKTDGADAPDTVESPSSKQSSGIKERSAKEKEKDADHAGFVAQAVLKLGAGGSELIGGTLQGAAKYDDAEGKMREATTTSQQAAADVAKKMMDDIEKFCDAALQFLKNQMTNEVERMSSLTRV